jgi:hypothetical protein
MPVIHLIDGEKGGTGKSWAARTMLQGYIDAGNASGRLVNAADVPFYGIEADRSNPTLSRIYGDCTQYVIFSEDAKFADEADELFDLARTHHLVVNLPAQVHVSLTRWIRQKGLIEYAAASGISLVKWFVSDGERDSLDVFVRSVEECGTEIPHVFVKNYGRCDEWGYFEAYESVQAAIQQYKVKVIDFPELAVSKRIPINAKSMTFAQARQYEGFPTLGRHQIVIYLREAYQAFESTGYFPSWTAPVTIALPSTAPESAPNPSEGVATKKRQTKAKAKPASGEPLVVA